MAFLRRETLRTMVSMADSTSDVQRGMSHILMDLENNLPTTEEELKETIYNWSACACQLSHVHLSFIVWVSWQNNEC